MRAIARQFRSTPAAQLVCESDSGIHRLKSVPLSNDSYFGNGTPSMSRSASRGRRSDLETTSLVNVDIARSFEGNYFPSSEIKPARNAVRGNYFCKSS